VLAVEEVAEVGVAATATKSLVLEDDRDEVAALLLEGGLGEVEEVTEDATEVLDVADEDALEVVDVMADVLDDSGVDEVRETTEVVDGFGEDDSRIELVGGFELWSEERSEDASAEVEDAREVVVVRIDNRIEAVDVKTGEIEDLGRELGITTE